MAHGPITKKFDISEPEPLGREVLVQKIGLCEWMCVASLSLSASLIPTMIFPFPYLFRLFGDERKLPTPRMDA
jgi:hypothetical protein